MEIEICKLTPDLTEDYVRFFDTTPHDDLVDEHKCYCVCWCKGNCKGGYERKNLSSREKRKNYAIQCIQLGSIQGYLAYSGGQVVGWCNANTKADCLKCYGWRRFMGDVPVEAPHTNRKVKSIFCFTIALEMKRKGVATQLLERVCKDAAQDGFGFVEAYPQKEFRETNCSGPFTMYQKSGFTVCCETEQGLVVRKQLKETNGGTA